MTQALRTAALPVLALLGAVLPLVYLPQLGDYLFYLRPSDLLPAYGTAWLFLAVLALPLWLLLALALRALAGSALEVALAGVAAALVFAAALYCLLVWLQTFGTLQGVALHGRLLWATLLVGGVLGATRRGRRWLHRGRPLLLASAALGALTSLTLPLYGWRSAAPPAQTAPAQTGTLARGASTARRARPNILLLSFDALSAEHMSLYGAQRPTTPMLARFAQSATTFEQAYSNGNFTTPGVSSMLTGTRPWTHRALQLQSWPTASTRRDSLPALLYRAGYETGYVSTNSAAGAAKNGLGRYFEFSSRDRIKDLDLCTDRLSALFRYACPVAAMPLFAALVSMTDRLHGGPGPLHYDPRLATEPALAWLRHIELQRTERQHTEPQSTDQSRPVFLWVHLFPPHSPYVTPSPWLGRFASSSQARNIAATEPHWDYSMGQLSAADVQLLAARYDESVLYADHYGGEFLQQALQILGPNTAVVITADHGESFRHGYGGHTGPALYNELIRIPLIIELPGQTQALRSGDVVEQIDIAPTLAQLAGLPIPASWEGHSLLGAWSEPDPLPSTPAFSMNFEQSPRFGTLSTGSVAVIDGHWKLVHYLGHLHYPQMPALHDTLYDLAADPQETTDLSTSRPDEVARLRALIDAQLARHRGPVTAAACHRAGPQTSKQGCAATQE